MELNADLLRSKERIAQLGKKHTVAQGAVGGMRIPPGQREVAKMVVMAPIVRDLQEISRDRWQLRVDGLVERSLTLSYDELLALARTNALYDIHCVTSWSRLDQRFTGVDFDLILSLVQPTQEAKFVIFESEADGYSTNVSLDELRCERALLAYEIDEAPISLAYGGPVRMVIPHLYYWKSSKYITRIRFVREDELGFWEVRGYHNHADPWKEERYSGND
jgi:DMSO/TMAO reductase YedYZ molybdopterin-dependent catalytic subunit